jgi:predicted ATPase
VAYLARRAPTKGLLIVITAREEELDDATLLRHTLADLASAGHVVTLGLTPLSRRDTATLVTMLMPASVADRAGAFRERIWTASEGNPLVAVQMTREIQEHGLPEDLALPGRAHDVINRRIERLAERSRLLLTVAAAIGREFDFEMLRRVSELDADATAQTVEELVRRRLLTGVGSFFDSGT